MNYKNIHDKIIEIARIENEFLKVGIERHHIIPKSLGGTNDKANIVKLTYRQHYVIHKLLVRILSGKDRWRMNCALKRFVHAGNVVISSKEYEKIKIMHNIGASLFLTGKKKSEETKKKMSEAQRKRFEETPTHWRGRTHTEETKKKMSEAQSTHNPQSGKPRTEEEKKKISETLKGKKKSEAHVEKIRNRIQSLEEREKRSNSIKLWWQERKRKQNESNIMGPEIS